MTVYPSESDPLRPFLQIGIEFQEWNDRFTSVPGWGPEPGLNPTESTATKKPNAY